MDETTKFISHMCHAHNNLCEKKHILFDCGFVPQ
jgi:hypothetical protein